MGLSERATAFFDSYVAAFETMDPAAIAGHFAFPLHMTSEGEPVALTAVPDAETWRGEIARLVSFYGDLGAATAHMIEASSTELSPRVEHVAIHWQLHDADGGDLYDFHAVYTLAEVEGATRVVALAHDELPRALAFMSRG